MNGGRNELLVMLLAPTGCHGIELLESILLQILQAKGNNNAGNDEGAFQVHTELPSIPGKYAQPFSSVTPELRTSSRLRPVALFVISRSAKYQTGTVRGSARWQPWYDQGN